MQIDVLIIGAGIAGCSVALNLAPFCKVCLVERHLTPPLRIGEALPPAANKLLVDMGLWDEFVGEGHLPNYSNQSYWGSDQLLENHFLRNPAGHGWHLDRQKFEIWLQNVAVRRGAVLALGTKVESLEQQIAGFWKINLQNQQEKINLEAKIVVDATGRSAFVAKKTGSNRKNLDNLLCAWLIGKDSPQKNPQGTSYIEAVAEGWWYSAPLPLGKRIVAFYTDSQVSQATWIRTKQAFIKTLQTYSELNAHIGLENFYQNEEEIEHGTTSAHSAITEPFVGKNWLAVGDSAFSFDPLSSQGMFNALYAGLAAAESIDRFLGQEIKDFSEYEQAMNRVWEAYKNHLRAWYGMEQRWKEHTFWKIRH